MSDAAEIGGVETAHIVDVDVTGVHTCRVCGYWGMRPPPIPCTGAPNTTPMVDVMDLFDRFWNATFGPAAEDWTAYGLTSDGSPCECGNCQTCGIRYALLWTHNLLSNPSLADLAERKRHEREERGHG